MGIFNIFGINNSLAATQAVQAVSSQEMSRRGFLALGGITALTLAGCGPSSETGPDAHPYPGDTGGTDAGGDVVVPTRLNLETGQFLALPWAFLSHLGYYTDRILGVGTDQSGVPNQIFDFLPSNPERPIPWTSRLQIPSVTDQHLNYLARQSTGNRYALTTNQGLYEIFLGATPSQSLRNFIDFPAPPTGQINFGGGAVYAGNKLFVALSSGTVGSDGITVTFGDVGNLVVYDVASNGVAQQDTVRLRQSGGRNPTGLARIPGTSTLLILNSGPVLNESAEASLVFFNTDSETIERTISLDAFRAQLLGDIAVTEDGKLAVIGSAQGADVVFVDLEMHEVAARTSITGTSFHPSVRIDDSRGVAYVSDYSGLVTMLNLTTHERIDSKSLSSAGPSALTGNGDLIQAIIEGARRLYPV